jgi:hypothetical protein
MRRLLVPVLVLLVLAGGAVVVFRDRLFGAGTAPSHPAEWDPRVADLVEFVGSERELAWVHPVYVDFLDEPQFLALLQQPAPAATDQAAALSRSHSQLYDALGLAVGYDATLDAATPSEASSLGFYSPDSDHISVRGDQLSPSVRLMLVHELTHALQVQHFGESVASPEDLALSSIVEADAMRVQDSYLATLTPQERDAAGPQAAATPDSAAGPAGVPWAVEQWRSAPSVLGPLLLDEVFANEGNAGVDALIATPPTEEVLLSPWLYGTEQKAADVTVTAPAGATVLDPPQPLSEFQMLLMLDAWLPWHQARGALDGWAGGSYTSYSNGSDVCFTATASFDESGDPFAVALAAWATAADSAAAPQITVNDVTFEACTRGPRAPAPPDPVISTLQALLVERDAVEHAGADASITKRTKYLCAADTMIDDPVLAPLLFADGLNTDEKALVIWQSSIAANKCGVPAFTPQP